MKNSPNTIFIDCSATLFPDRVAFTQNSNNEKLHQWNFGAEILNTNADIVAVNLLNYLYLKKDFNLVLIDNWIIQEKHQKEFFEELLEMNGVQAKLHDKWMLENNNKEKSPLGPITDWLKNYHPSNYTVVLDEKYKYQLDFDVDSKVDYNHSIFVDPRNGLSVKNIMEVNKSFRFWL